MRISYKKAAKEDATEQLGIQRKAFLPLYEKYQDDESPANMSLEKMEGKIENPYGSYYVITADGKTAGEWYSSECNSVHGGAISRNKTVGIRCA